MTDPDGPNVIVTHRKPHLDEVVGAWLLRTFDPSFANCSFHFIAQNPQGGDMPTGHQFIGLGVGRGKYDEHGLSARESATRLVYQDLRSRGLLPNKRFTDQALEWLVDYAHKEDTGQWEKHDENYTSFSIPAILRGVWLTQGQSDQAMMDVGMTIIDAVAAQLNEKAKFMADWDQRIEFESRWGKAVALISTYRASDVYAYDHGYVLRVQKDPTKDFGDFRGPADSTVDLAPIYEQVNQQEPNAWFLHQSHKILVASNDAASGLPTTKIALQQLIDLVKA